MALQTVVNRDEIGEYRVGQLVALVEYQQGSVQEGYHRDGVFQHVAQVGGVGGRAHLLGNLAHEVRTAHVFRAEDVEHVAVRAPVLDGGCGLPASGIAHHPRHVLVRLRVGEGVGDLTERTAFVQLPVFETEADLDGDAREHVVAYQLVLAVEQLAHRGGAYVLQAFRRTVAGRVVVAVRRQRRAYLFFLFCT